MCTLGEKSLENDYEIILVLYLGHIQQFPKSTECHHFFKATFCWVKAEKIKESAVWVTLLSLTFGLWVERSIKINKTAEFSR